MDTRKANDIWTSHEARERRRAIAICTVLSAAVMLGAWLIAPSAARSEQWMPPDPPDGFILDKPACSDSQKIIAGLAREYGEKLVSYGLQTNGQLLQIFSSPENNTWTVISSSPDGTSCLIAAGKFWVAEPAGEAS